MICQVARLAAAGTLPGKQVKVPGALVDYLVVVPDQWQTYVTRYDPAYAGASAGARTPALPCGCRSTSARSSPGGRRSSSSRGRSSTSGFGVSNGIAPVAAEEGIHREVTLTVEQGIVGGVPAGGNDAGAGYNYDAMIDQPYQFDFYDGGGLDLAFLSFAEVDADGNVNVSRFGRVVNGPGGFVNISQGARKVVFSGTLTADGLEIAPDGRAGLRLVREGRTGEVGAGRPADHLQRAIRAGAGPGGHLRDRSGGVPARRRTGSSSSRSRPGVDLERDVLGRIGFPVQVPRAAAPDGRPPVPAPSRWASLAEFRARRVPPARARRPEP